MRPFTRNVLSNRHYKSDLDQRRKSHERKQKIFNGEGERERKEGKKTLANGGNSNLESSIDFQ